MLIAAIIFLLLAICLIGARAYYIKKAAGINECEASYSAAAYTVLSVMFVAADLVMLVIWIAMYAIRHLQFVK